MPLREREEVQEMLLVLIPRLWGTLCPLWEISLETCLSRLPSSVIPTKLPSHEGCFSISRQIDRVGGQLRLDFNQSLDIIEPLDRKWPYDIARIIYSRD